MFLKSKIACRWLRRCCVAGERAGTRLTQRNQGMTGIRRLYPL